MISSAAEVGKASGGGMRSSGQVLPGRGAERAAEHGGEGAGAAVTKALGDPRDGLALGEPSHGLRKPHLLAPLGEAHTGLALEEPRKRARAGADALGPVVERVGFGGIVEESAAECREPCIRG